MSDVGTKEESQSTQHGLAANGSQNSPQEERSNCLRRSDDLQTEHRRARRSSLTRELRRGAAIPRFATLLLLGVTLSLLSATTAKAQFEIGASGGVFFPMDGKSGPSAQLRIGGGPSEHWRIAGELEWRKFKSELFGLDDVDIQSIDLRAVVNYIFLPDAFLTPYIGAGLGLGVNLIDNEAIEEFLIDTTPDAVDADVSPAGLSAGVFGLIGLQVPFGDHVRIFGEGRFGGDWMLTGKQVTDTGSGTSGETEIDAENLGGFSAIGGVRIVF